MGIQNYEEALKEIRRLDVENERLRAALKEIANFPRDADEGVLKDIARRALAD